MIRNTSSVFPIVCFSPNTECEVMHSFCIYTSKFCCYATRNKLFHYIKNSVNYVREIFIVYCLNDAKHCALRGILILFKYSSSALVGTHGVNTVL